jgi:sphingomyelin phosphodiesterase
LFRFANTITGQFNGHTHEDEFHVYYSQKHPRRAVGAAFNGASVTPFVNVNPSFKYYYVDPETFVSDLVLSVRISSVSQSLLDYDEWTFNLTLANSHQSQPLNWYKLYSFVDTYGSANLLPSEVDKVVHRMAKNHSLIDKYFM